MGLVTHIPKRHLLAHHPTVILQVLATKGLEVMTLHNFKGTYTVSLIAFEAVV